MSFLAPFACCFESGLFLIVVVVVIIINKRIFFVLSLVLRCDWHYNPQTKCNKCSCFGNFDDYFCFLRFLFLFWLIQYKIFDFSLSLSLSLLLFFRRFVGYAKILPLAQKQFVDSTTTMYVSIYFV